jgi:Arc/MetJ-type ribon-helix-helix transcriptional regulator
VLDPTGRAARVDPSQITEIPDSSFGLGKSNRIPKETMAKITDKIRSGLRVSADDFGEYQRLLNSRMTPEERDAALSASSSRGTSSKARLQSSGPIGGEFDESAAVGVAELDDKDAVEERRDKN